MRDPFTHPRCKQVLYQKPKKHLTGTLNWYTKCRAHPLGHSLELTPLHNSGARASLLPTTYICLLKQSLLSPASPTLFVSVLPHPSTGRQNCISLHPESYSNITVWGILKCKWIQEVVDFWFREIYSLLHPQTSLLPAMYLAFFLFPDMHIPHWLLPIWKGSHHHVTDREQQESRILH